MIGECKRFMAYDIVNNLKESDNQIILEQLKKVPPSESPVSGTLRLRGQNYITT